MGFLTSFFNRNRAAKAATAVDVARGEKMHGHETGQTLDEQQATRGRMEAEMDAQRLRRAQPPPRATPACPHTTLVPRWDSVADMGNQDLVTTYTCESCQQSFTAAEGRALQETEAARLRQELRT